MVVTGSGNFFVSGADIKEFSKLGTNKGIYISLKLRSNYYWYHKIIYIRNF
jgi:enoyl-CoA hydratase/carnithine racemase